ncbi:endonuclease YncB(thermonuclease family) [Aureimonas jatrophae]|uniref:Endonuclease YncB, thermonuclease family n=1 Tax=Aureimonas jatrophae TaxID=1166073 RepID=A0A1H0GRB9_9HYPH|nr:endonuclease YncB(thermonuclease family) [Aureimonas jatrophae]SDO09400.1 Endonuclease YncB, thermonuclease family [Aureimonas jatrophae]
MNELRISLGICACTVFLLAIAPAAPTLISASQPETVAADQPASSDTTRTVRPTSGTQEPTRSPLAGDGPRAPDPAPATMDNADVLTRGDSAPTVVAAAQAAPKLELFNRPVAVDAGTMKAGRTTLRIADIQPISPDARCSDGPQTWPCGIRARTAFRSWLRGRSVLCSVPADQNDTADLIVSCLAGEADIGEWLVANGWAAATSDGRYAELEAAARSTRKGIWAFEVGR